MQAFMTGAVALALAGGSAGMAGAAEQLPIERTDDVPISAFKEEPTDPAEPGDGKEKPDDSKQDNGKACHFNHSEPP